MKKGVPFVVKIRTYLFHAVIALIVLAVSVLLFQFLSEDAATGSAELKRINDAPCNEVVYSYKPYGEESFYYLNRHHLVGAKGDGISCDILMMREGAEYCANDIYFTGALKEGTAKVSKNLASKYGAKIGDKLTVVGTGLSFVVTGYLPAQSGLDKDYLRDGVAVLAYNAAMLEESYLYLSFATDGDSYPELKSLVFIKDWKKDGAVKVAVGASVFVGAFAVCAAFCEYFLFASRRRDFRVLVGLGQTHKKLALTSLAENAAKYVCPVGICAAFYSIKLACYGALYAYISLFSVGVAALFVAIYSLVSIRGMYYGRR